MLRICLFWETTFIKVNKCCGTTLLFQIMLDLIYVLETFYLYCITIKYSLDNCKHLYIFHKWNYSACIEVNSQLYVQFYVDKILYCESIELFALTNISILSLCLLYFCKSVDFCRQLMFRILEHNWCLNITDIYLEHFMIAEMSIFYHV